MHTWTFRNDASGYGFADPQTEMTYYYDLGVDGLFTDFPDTGVDEPNALHGRQKSSMRPWSWQAWKSLRTLPFQRAKRSAIHVCYSMLLERIVLSRSSR